MITQWLFDFLSGGLAGLVQLIPPLPVETGTGTSWVQGATDYLVDLISPLAIVLPFDAIGIAITAWLGAVAFWGATLFIAWTVGLVQK